MTRHPQPVQSLTASRDHLREAFRAAQAALVDLADATTAHDRLVRAAIAEQPDLGCQWRPVSAAALLTLIGERVRSTRVGSRDGAVLEVRRLTARLGLHDRADLGLASIGLPPETPQLGSVFTGIDIPEATGAPVGISDYDRARDLERLEVKYTA